MHTVTFTKGGKFPLHALTFAPNTNIQGVLDTFSPWDMILVFVDLPPRDGGRTHVRNRA